MILYEVVCDRQHSFEAWFRDSATYDAQVAAGEVACPVCGSTDVHKALMAPRIASRKPSAETAAAAKPGGVDAEKVRAVLHALRETVEKNCDYVGDQFAEEARKIHYGETDSRGIYGETTAEEARELREEGIEFMSLPWPRTRTDA